MKKNKYKQIFSYLQKFTELRNKTICDIESSADHHQQIIWLDQIPESDIFENILLPDFDSQNDYWLKVSKPEQPQKPQFPELPKELEGCVDKKNLFGGQSDTPTSALLAVVTEESNLNVKEKKEKAFQEYCDTRLSSDRHWYQEQMAKYLTEYDLFKKLEEAYTKLFKLSNKTDTLGDEYELVIGVGLLCFQESAERPKINRHLFTQKVEIKFDYTHQDSRIIVNPLPESAPKLETDFLHDVEKIFSPDEIVATGKVVMDLIETKDKESIFDDFEEVMRLFGERIAANGQYNSSAAKPEKTPVNPTVFHAPALLLRKRNTESFTAMYKNILANIEKEDASFSIPVMDNLIHSKSDKEGSFNGHSTWDKVDFNQIYFPKEYNEEQLQIIEKAKYNDKVLVQGPPGTGKSHTIVNLICHLLAIGKKILITAETKRALEVLKDKLPEEFKNLAVNYLSDESDSLKDLQGSVNAIEEELGRGNLQQYKDNIRQLEDRLNAVKMEIARKSNELIEEKTNATRLITVNERYKGTPQQIGEALEKDASLYKWYKDEYGEESNEALLAKLQEFIAFQQRDEIIHNLNLEKDLAASEAIIPPDTFSSYCHLHRELTSARFSDARELELVHNDTTKLKQQLLQLRDLHQEINAIQLSFTTKVIQSFLAWSGDKWFKQLEDSKGILERLAAYDLQLIDRDIEVSYPEDKSLKQLKYDARLLLDFLKQGKKLKGFAYPVKRLFFPAEVKERLYVKEEVRVNGSGCDSAEALEHVLRDIAIKQDLSELDGIWQDSKPESTDYSKAHAHYVSTTEKVRLLVEKIYASFQLKEKIEAQYGLGINLFEQEGIGRHLLNLEYSDLKKQYEALEATIADFEEYLIQGSFHPVKTFILRAIEDKDASDYEKALQDVENLAEQKAILLQYQALRNDTYARIPHIAEAVEKGNFQHQDIEALREAFLYKHARLVFEKLIEHDNEEELGRKLAMAEKEEKKIIAELAAQKAWHHVLKGINEKSGLKEHLRGWVSAVKKIGKSRKGKKAVENRRIAQNEMKYCKEAVPCWIMPLYKVVDTISPVVGMFDYIIIDEASQLGPEAFFLLYLGKRIIIVGDDKQTSPEYVGVDTNAMKPHIENHLQGIPYKDFYHQNYSFFDHAYRFCNGSIILREHFRCMPEIIEFSNKYFYRPEGKDLYPLRQYSANRLQPLMTVYCKQGYIEGKGQNIINIPEAEMIADTIAALLKDEMYKGKTFGVIALQGNNQEKIIEQKILDKIGINNFHARKIVVGKSSSFQGDERDIMFLSLITAHNHKRRAFVTENDERRFNVAVSRARDQVWLFHSVPLKGITNENDLRYKLLDHFENFSFEQQAYRMPVDRKGEQPPEPFDSWFEVDVYNDIVSKNVSIIPQYKVAGWRYRIDMVAILPDGQKIAIECDGDQWHGIDRLKQDMARQKILERCGWQFFRVKGSLYYANREKALAPLWELIPVEMRSSSEGPSYKEYRPEIEFEAGEKESVQEERSLLGSEEQAGFPEESLKRDEGSLVEDSYFNLLKSGQFTMSDNEPAGAAVMSLSIKKAYPGGYLLFCFRSGQVRKIPVKTLFEKQRDKPFPVGVAAEDKLLHIIPLAQDTILGIFTKEASGLHFKAHLTAHIPEQSTVDRDGVILLQSAADKVGYKLFPMESYAHLKASIAIPFTAVGKPFNKKNFGEAFDFIRAYLKGRR